jgi:hypothetical protein
MEEEKAFYKLEPSNKNRPILICGTFISSKNYKLDIALKDTYIYPIDGWTYYDSFDEAAIGFNLTEAQKEQFKEDLFPTEEEIDEI